MKRATLRENQNNYRLKDGIGFLHPFEEAVNLLGHYEDLFYGRTFWIVYYVWEEPKVIPVKVTGVREGVLEAEWNYTEGYAEVIPNVDVTELFKTKDDALRYSKSLQKQIRPYFTGKLL